MHSRVFCVTFFCILCPFFFCFLPFVLGSAYAEKSKDFVVYFFVALIKLKIRVKYEKCIVSVPYFVVCFAKTFTKYLQNAKYENV